MIIKQWLKAKTKEVNQVYYQKQKQILMKTLKIKIFFQKTNKSRITYPNRLTQVKINKNNHGHLIKHKE